MICFAGGARINPQETKVGQLNFTSVCRLYSSSSLLPPLSLSLLLEAIAQKTHLSPASCYCCLLHATATVAANDYDQDSESSRALRVGAKNADNNEYGNIGMTRSSSTQDDVDCRDCFR